MHPYKAAPDRSFWSKSVSKKYDPSDLVSTCSELIRRGEKIATAGSCFASELIPYLEQSGFVYLRTERVHPSLCKAQPENFGYAKFSAAYGNIYTARQLLQLLRRCDSRFAPAEDRWLSEEGVIDPFRPGLRYKAISDLEFDLLTKQHLRAVRRVFSEADVFIFTLGLTEAWVSRVDGAVFPACPGTIAGTFAPEKHAFHNFTVSEVVADLAEFVGELRRLNAKVRVILTVSPVPLVATATGNHVLTASTYSKSVLRVAADEVASSLDGVTYFPSYEIVTSSRAPDSFFEADRRNVSVDAVKQVMQAFLARCECTAPELVVPDGSSTPGAASAADAKIAQELSTRFAAKDCEEVMVDRG